MQFLFLPGIGQGQAASMGHLHHPACDIPAKRPGGRRASADTGPPGGRLQPGGQGG